MFKYDPSSDFVHNFVLVTSYFHQNPTLNSVLYVAVMLLCPFQSKYAFKIFENIISSFSSVINIWGDPSLSWSCMNCPCLRLRIVITCASDETDTFNTSNRKVKRACFPRICQINNSQNYPSNKSTTTTVNQPYEIWNQKLYLLKHKIIYKKFLEKNK